jgi:hypothetical protein
VLYQAEAASSGQLYSLLDQIHEDHHNRLLDVKVTTEHEAAQVQFTLEAQPALHQQLRKRLRDEFDTHKIVSYSSSEQE